MLLLFVSPLWLDGMSLLFAHVVHLHHAGEGISSEELVDHLMTLLGFVDDPEAQFVYNEDPIKAIKENISQNITVGKFTEEILGFQL